MNVTALDTEKYLQKYTELIKQLLNETDKRYLKIGYHLLELKEINRYHIKSGYEDIFQYSEQNFKLKKTTIYNLINIIKQFTAIDSKGNYTQTLKEHYQGYNYSQLRILLTIPQELHDKFNHEMSVRYMEQLKKELQQKENIPEPEPDLSIETDEDLKKNYKKLYEELLEEYQKQADEVSKLNEIHKKYLKLFRENKDNKEVIQEYITEQNNYRVGILKTLDDLDSLSSKLVINKKLNLKNNVERIKETLESIIY